MRSTTVSLLSDPKYFKLKLLSSSLFNSVDMEYILNVALIQLYIMNSISTGERDSNSLKSKRSNKT